MKKISIFTCQTDKFFPILLGSKFHFKSDKINFKSVKNDSFLSEI